MTWLVLAGGAAVFYALHGAWSKRVTSRVGPLVGAWAFFAFALPFIAAYLWWEGLPPVAPSFWPILGANVVLNLVASYLFLSALRSGDLGVTYPLLALTPLFVIPVEFQLLGELPGLWGALGIALVVVGIYLLNFSDRKAGLLAPFLALARNPGARRSLAVAVLWSVSGTLDRMAVLASSAGFYGVGLAGGLAVLFLPVIWIARRRGHREGLEGSGRDARPDGPAVSSVEVGNAPPPAGVPGVVERYSHLLPDGRVMLIIHGMLFALMFILQMEALELALASYVLSIKRTGAILAVVLGWLAFREGAFGPRILGTVVTLCGVTILVVWG